MRGGETTAEFIAVLLKESGRESGPQPRGRDAGFADPRTGAPVRN
jgi:hypothetical protein